MFVGIYQFELLVRSSRSLKDKRRVVKSVKDRLHREHLVSVAEIAALDHQRLAVLGLALVGASAARIDSVFDRIESKLRALHDAELGETMRQIIRGDQPPMGSEVDREALWTEDDRREETAP
ncbi:MAG: DUF503 domain-containing protein [Phycisphaerales bacterium]